MLCHVMSGLAVLCLVILSLSVAPFVRSLNEAAPICSVTQMCVTPPKAGSVNMYQQRVLQMTVIVAQGTVAQQAS